MYLGTSPLPLPPVPPQTGFWAVLHEIRSEYAQIMVALYLLINGPGKWSIECVASPAMSRLGFSLPSKSEIAAVSPAGFFLFWAMPKSVLYKSPGWAARSFELRMFVM
jgi:hypothetical protein